MFKIKRSGRNDTDLLVGLRLKALKEVNKLGSDYNFPESFVSETRTFFQREDQTTVIAYDEEVVGCATMCCLDLMPTFDHPGGKRAHIMNVYVDPSHRRQGIASVMLGLLVDEAKNRGITEITLDSTEAGRELYLKNGFRPMEKRMSMDINELLRDSIEHTGIYSSGCRSCSGCRNKE